MDVKRAAEAMEPLILAANGLPEKHPEYGRDHLIDMCIKIRMEVVTDEKAHRWLGWIQGCVCVGGGGGANLESLKLINKAA